jgi:hypothetical protein
MHRLAIVWMVVLVACTQTVADDALRACDPLCGCTQTLPTAQRNCTTGCLAAFEMEPLTEVCTACIVDHRDRCATLLDDCIPQCTQAVPLRSYVGASPSRTHGI